jgi:sugar phosphate isomerase/epimerase
MPSIDPRIPFRLGTTSYIIPDEILPNARYLASQVRDIELILFELDDGPNNLPSPALVHELNSLAAQHDLTFTVHLPLDLRLGNEGEAQHCSLQKAQRVIAATLALQPWAYVLHLDGTEVRASRDPLAISRWQDQSVHALEIVSAWAGGPEKLAVENLESYPLDFLEPIFTRIAVSRCVDIGHLWCDGHDPLPYLERALARTRVIHLHGINGRDHQSLHHMPFTQRDPLIKFLTAHYQGVVTLEIFNEADLHASLAAVGESFDSTDSITAGSL